MTLPSCWWSTVIPPSSPPNSPKGTRVSWPGALQDIGISVPDEVTPPQAIRDLFRSRHRAGDVTVSAGLAASRKGEFAEALAGADTRDARRRRCWSTGAGTHRASLRVLVPNARRSACGPCAGGTSRSDSRARHTDVTSALAHAGAIADLTAEQRLAAASSASKLFIEAGPGTGKTTVSAQRFGVQRFASEHRHDSRAVVAVSFTRAATYTLRRRVQRLWGGPAALTWPHRIVTLDTVMCDLLHDLLRERLVIWPNMDALWPDGNVVLDVRDSWASCGGTVSTRSIYSLHLSGRHVQLRKDFAPKHAYRVPAVAVVPHMLAGTCTHQDVRDILELALRDPLSASRVRQRLGDVMRALIVDEVFDANDLDIAIIESAIAAGVAVTLVGDPWQALYLFRGARPHLVPERLRRAKVPHTAADPVFPVAQ